MEAVTIGRASVAQRAHGWSAAAKMGECGLGNVLDRSTGTLRWNVTGVSDYICDCSVRLGCPAEWWFLGIIVLGIVVLGIIKERYQKEVYREIEKPDKTDELRSVRCRIATGQCELGS
jgi:hypothetical protein